MRPITAILTAGIALAISTSSVVAVERTSVRMSHPGGDSLVCRASGSAGGLDPTKTYKVFLKGVAANSSETVLDSFSSISKVSRWSGFSDISSAGSNSSVYPNVKIVLTDSYNTIITSKTSTNRCG